MPNWCMNTVTLEHEDPAMIARAKAAFAEGKFLHEFVPVPLCLTETVAGCLGDPEKQAELEKSEQDNLNAYNYKNWYDFCIGEWGTKWDAKTEYDESYTIEGNQLTIFFDTAWSPPMQIYYALEEMGFEVEATYVEQGVGYIGFYSDGVDNCEKMTQFYPEPSDDPEMEDSAMDEITLKIYDYFEKNGFTHSPTNLGG